MMTDVKNFVKTQHEAKVMLKITNKINMKMATCQQNHQNVRLSCFSGTPLHATQGKRSGLHLLPTGQLKAMGFVWK